MLKKDIQQRMLVEQQVEADRVLESIHQALSKDGDALLSVEERQLIDDAIQQVSDARQQGDADTIKAAIERLDEATTDFAARRMDVSIRTVLQGQQIDEVN